MPLSSFRLEVRVVGGGVEIIGKTGCRLAIPPTHERELFDSTVIERDFSCDIVRMTPSSYNHFIIGIHISFLPFASNYLATPTKSVYVKQVRVRHIR